MKLHLVIRLFLAIIVLMVTVPVCCHGIASTIKNLIAGYIRDAAEKVSAMNKASTAWLLLLEE